MTVIKHPANSRGTADFGWLKSSHSFSFGSYFDSSRIRFGLLRVLNDDQVAPGMGFGTHPHDNMEIISIPLEGELAHKDSLGNASIIKTGEVQVMSAGTGITHSEFNNSQHESVKFLQLWIYPNQKNVAPRYGQFTIDNQLNNQWQLIVGPQDAGLPTWVHQNAWLSLGKFSHAAQIDYQFHKPLNGVYVFLISGSVEVNGVSLSSRDGAGFTETELLNFSILTSSYILIIEVPMEL